MNIAEKLDRIDEILIYYEGWMHGEDGDNCTEARILITEIENELSEKSSLLSGVISESGNSNLPKFRKPPPPPPPIPRTVQGTKRAAVCLHCGLGREFHSKYTKMCGDSMHRFEAD